MEAKLKKLYYSDKGYWKSNTAIRKLIDLTGYSEKDVKSFLKKQAIWQIFLPAPKHIVRPKFQNSKPNDTHQIDLLFLPYDTVGRKKYKYALTVIDIGSRYKEAEQLTSKNSSEVAEALTKIYNRGPLKFPRMIQADSGNEFKGPFNQLMLKHGVIIRRGIPGLHRQQAFVENLNKQLAEHLFTYQYSKELISNKTNTEWVRRLPVVIKEMNSEINSAINLRPIDAIKQKEIKSALIKSKSGKPDLSILNKKVRYLYEPGEIAGDTRKRITDPIWSLSTYEVEKVMSTNPPLYYLRPRKDGLTPKRGFVKEELQIVPPDTVPLKF